MIFFSKKDIWLSIVIFVIGIGLFISLIFTFLHEDLGTTELSVFGVIVVTMNVFLLWIWFKTYYAIRDDDLLVVSGPLRKTIAFKSVISVTKTSNLLSSFALSTKRIEILYGSYQLIYISPEDRDLFIRQLIAKHPHIKLKTDV